MIHCGCTAGHDGRRVVLTGGPGAGKSAVLELVRLFFCGHVRTLPEAAGIVFGGGFPRDGLPGVRQAAQRAIYHVQRELEATAALEPAALVLCDRGTIDSAAYWEGDGDLFTAVGTTRAAELARYAAVILLRTPTAADAYNHDNPLRVESLEEAQRVDVRIAAAWAEHPTVYEIPATYDFLTKAAHALEHLREQVPACCRERVRPIRWAE